MSRGRFHIDNIVDDSEPTYYETLGVPRNATQEDIQTAYTARQQNTANLKQKAAAAAENLDAFYKDHKGSSLSWDQDKVLKSLQETAHITALEASNMPMVDLAYAVLSQPEKRRTYDEEIQRNRQNKIMKDVHQNLRRILAVDSRTAFFDTDNTSIPTPPEFLFLRISPGQIGLQLNYDFPNSDPLETAIYFHASPKLFTSLAEKATELFVTELFSKMYRGSASDGFYATEQAAAVSKNKIIAQVRYKDPTKLDVDPILSEDILFVRSSGSKKVFENQQAKASLEAKSDQSRKV